MSNNPAFFRFVCKGANTTALYNENDVYMVRVPETAYVGDVVTEVWKLEGTKLNWMGASDLKLYKDDPAYRAGKLLLITDEPPTHNKTAPIIIELPEKPAIGIWR
jgi:hypothetical protein